MSVLEVVLYSIRYECLFFLCRSFYSANAFLMDTEAVPIAIELLQGMLITTFAIAHLYLNILL